MEADDADDDERDEPDASERRGFVEEDDAERRGAERRHGVGETVGVLEADRPRDLEGAGDDEERPGRVRCFATEGFSPATSRRRPVARYGYAVRLVRSRRMRRRALLGLLAVGGTAGCLRLEGGDGTTTATTGTGAGTETVETATATDAATDPATETEPETATEREEATYPFGVSEDGVDPYLYSTCQSAVAELSYRSQYTKVDVESGTRKWAREYEADGGAALGHWNRKNGGPVDAYHPVGGDMLWREEVEGAFTFGLNSSNAFENVFWDEELKPLLEGPAWSAPERVNDDRPAIWELTADSVGKTVRSPGHMQGELKSVEGARLRVDENGVIRRVDAVYEASNLDGNVRRYRFRFVVSDVGSVSLSTPSWVKTARENRPRIGARLTDDRKYVRIAFESGSIAPGSRISVFDHGDSDRKYVGHTDREVSTGDVLYVHARTDTGHFNEAGIGYGDRSAAGTPPTLDSEYHVVSFRRDTMYHPGVDVAPPN